MTEAYVSDGWSELRGRGMVAAVTLDRDWQRDLLGKSRCVEIDGKRYEVLAAESFAIQDLKKGMKVGLLVRPLLPDEGLPTAL